LLGLSKAPSKVPYKVPFKDHSRGQVKERLTRVPTKVENRTTRMSIRLRLWLIRKVSCRKVILVVDWFQRQRRVKLGRSALNAVAHTIR
jgi:hypothetical protein